MSKPLSIVRHNDKQIVMDKELFIQILNKGIEAITGIKNEIALHSTGSVIFSTDGGQKGIGLSSLQEITFSIAYQDNGYTKE